MIDLILALDFLFSNAPSILPVTQFSPTASVDSLPPVVSYLIVNVQRHSDKNFFLPNSTLLLAAGKNALLPLLILALNVTVRKNVYNPWS